MSLGKMEFDNNNKTTDKAERTEKGHLGEILIPILTMMTIVNCVIILVLVVNIGKKVNVLEQKVLALQNVKIDYQFHPVSDVTGNVVDESEAEDIAEVAAIEDNSVWNGNEDSSAGIKRVYLTFDDGPSANTDKILDILSQYGVKATFFVVGKDKYPDQYKRIVAEGHTLGMHSYSHKYNDIYASLDAYKQDLTQLHDFLYELTGEDCNIVRFPGGSSNTISRVDMWELIAYLDENDMVYFDWNVSSGDATGENKTAEQIAKNVLENINKHNNSVILFHDASGKNSTVEALPMIIEQILSSDNTVILPISEDTVRIQHLHK